MADWRTSTLENVRQAILAADADVVETIKWRKPSNPDGVPVWECDGILCTGEIYKDKVKLTFMHGGALPDPSKLFNSGLDGGARRAIDIIGGETIDAAALQNLIRSAIAHNRSKKAK